MAVDKPRSVAGLDRHEQTVVGEPIDVIKIGSLLQIIEAWLAHVVSLSRLGSPFMADIPFAVKALFCRC